MRLPPPPSPLAENADAVGKEAPAPAAANLASAGGAPATPSTELGREKGFMKAEIDEIVATEHDLEALRVSLPLTIPREEEQQPFDDPFKRQPDPEEEEKAPPEPEEPVEKEAPPKYSLGRATTDTEGGDAGLLFRPPTIEPFPFFVRSLFVS